MRTLTLISLVLAMVLAGCTGAKKAQKSDQPVSAAGEKMNVEPGRKLVLAVKSLVPKGVEHAVADMLTNQLCTEIAKRRQYDVRCADDVRAVMRMKTDTMMMGGDVDEEKLTELDENQLKGVDRLVEGQVGKVGENHVMNLKIIDPKTGKVQARTNVVGSEDPGSLMGKIPEAVAALL